MFQKGLVTESLNDTGCLANVLSDVEGYTHHVLLQDFLDRFFPAHEACSTIFESLKANGLYSSNRWSALPAEPGGEEKAYYGPITDLMNAIVDSDEVQQYATGTKARWVNRNDKAPTRVTQDAPKVLPNCMDYAGTKEELDMIDKAIEVEIEKLATEQAELERRQQACASLPKDKTNELVGGLAPASQQSIGHTPTATLLKEQEHASASQQLGESTNETKDQQIRTLKRKFVSNDGEQTAQKIVKRSATLSQDVHQIIRAAWARTINVLEAKSREPLYEETLVQLGSCMRQIFRVQLDRLFVFGIILLHRKVSLWYCDRSGFVGTGNQLIDMDESPELFIRVIFNLSTLPPERLGYNPYMKRVLSDGQTRHSYDCKITEEDSRKFRNETRWRFTIPSQNPESKPHEYETTHSLSIARSDIMCGRATMVWAVVDRNTKEPLVLKQCWRRIEDDEPEETFEGFPDGSLPGLEGGGREVSLYKIIADDAKEQGDLSRRLVAAFDLPRTRTLQSLRGGLRKLPKFDSVETLVDRQLCLMVFSVIGRPVKYFLNLDELVRTFRGALQEYQLLYSRGILHRDISSGNILIRINEAGGALSPTHTSGTLIDLDHAKHLGRKPEKLLVRLTQQAEDLDQARLREVLSAVLDIDGFPVHPSARLADFVLLLHSGLAGSALESFKFMVKEAEKNPYKAFEKGATVDFGELGIILDDKTCIPLDATRTGTRDDVCTGTLPYVSHELLSSFPPAHTMLHDMESVFWVLLHICLTRGGPCGRRREELDDELADGEDDKTKIRLHSILYCLFETPHLLEWNKFRAIKEITQDHFEESLLAFIHPYFSSLKPLLRAWWRILSLAYQTKRSSIPEFFEQYPVVAFLSALADVDIQEPDVKEGNCLRQQEIAIRKSYIEPFDTKPDHITHSRPSTPPPLHTAPQDTTPQQHQSNLPTDLDHIQDSGHVPKKAKMDNH